MSIFSFKFTAPTSTPKPNVIKAAVPTTQRPTIVPDAEPVSVAFVNARNVPISRRSFPVNSVNVIISLVTETTVCCAPVPITERVSAIIVSVNPAGPVTHAIAVHRTIHACHLAATENCARVMALVNVANVVVRSIKRVAIRENTVRNVLRVRADATNSRNV